VTHPSTPEPHAEATTGASQGTGDGSRTETWRQILTGEDPMLRRLRRGWRHVPTAPRCKVCAAPFAGAGGILTRVINHGRSASNPLLCNACFSHLRSQIGGAEVEISVLFADVRGSTGLAERTSTAGFRSLIQQFYAIAAQAVDRHDGYIDKFLGDGVMALFIPVLSGENHVGRAIDAAVELLDRARRPDLIAGGVEVGVGVHTGSAFVGVVGVQGKLDFTALGDTVNVAARLGSLAGRGELFVSRAAWERAGRAPGDQVRTVEVIGRSAPLDVVVLRAATSVTL
jgi:adenylate cyclase